MSDTLHELVAWQVVDSAFPTGAFAHSAGLESAWQHGEVTDGRSLEEFAVASVWQSAYATLPLVNVTYRESHRIAELDALADAFLTNPVANRASRVQGRALVATAARICKAPALRQLKDATDSLCAHVAPVSGAVLQALGLPLASVQRMILFTAARGVLSAGVRLGIVGSFEAQQLQLACLPNIVRVAEACAQLGADDLAQTAPILDLLQAQHDRLYSRLFQS